MDLRFLVPLLQDGATPLIRTEFSDDVAWARVIAAVTGRVIVSEPDPEIPGDDGGYTPHIRPIDDPAFTDSAAAAFAEAWRPHRDEALGYVLLADAQTMRAAAGEELTVVYVDLYAADDDAELGWVYGNSFRCVAGEVASIEVNLGIANMDFSDFADHAEEHAGVFRGFDA
ncbi:DUF6924 domain-containing protein [Nocardioides sp. P5_C9_2]